MVDSGQGGRRYTSGYTDLNNKNLQIKLRVFERCLILSKTDSRFIIITNPPYRSFFAPPACVPPPAADDNNWF